jgi:hypothetical protein
MLDFFKPDFFWMLREAKGYFPWAKRHPYKLYSYMWRKCHMCHDGPPPHRIIREILTEQYVPNDVIDLFFKALIRAEIRFISRYIPQRSHEERLTGHLVSEIDNALCLTSRTFQSFSMERYKQAKNLDFLYYDLSRGGKIEKKTGADLGFILIVDLPDYPYLVKSVVLQAKKIDRSAQLTVEQHTSLLSHGEDKAAYLFYDMDLKSLASPTVLRLDDYDLKKTFNEAQEKFQSSFSLDYDNVMDGVPLSYFFIDELMDATRGMVHSSFDEAFQYFTSKLTLNKEPFQGILGIVSLGRAIQFSPDPDIGLRIRV